MDFIKDSAVKTVNGIKTEFAKTAKRERQNGETERQNGKTETDKNGKTTKRPVKIETAKCKTVKPKRQNGKTVKTAKRQTVKTVNGKTISFETENGNGQNGQF